MANKNYTANKSGKSALITVIAIVAALIIIALAAFNAFSGKGIILRSKTAAESENFKMSGTMMAYAAGSAYQQIFESFEALGVDTTKSLKEQYLPTGDNSMSWFDYIMESAKGSTDQILSLCEYAKANGIELDDEAKALVKENMDALKDTAASYNYPSVDNFVKAVYRNGVNEKDVEKFVELYVLSSKGSEAFADSVKPTLEDEEAYYAEHPDEFNGVDFYAYSVKLAAEETDDESVEIDVSEDESAAAVLDAIGFSQKLAEAKDADEFKSLVREYEATLDPEADEEALDEIAESTFQKHVLKSAIGNEEVSAWLFDEANIGKVNLITDTENGVYTVYLLDKGAYRDETKNRAVRHILIEADKENPDDDSAAQEILAALKEANFSEEKWNELASEKSIDAGSNENGGLYDDVVEGQTYESFNDWLFDEARVEGDSGIVKSNAGWHVMYYVGEAENSAWMTAAKDGITYDKYNAMLEEMGDSIKYDDKVINMISFN